MHVRKIICGLATSECSPLFSPLLVSFCVYECRKPKSFSFISAWSDGTKQGMMSQFERKTYEGGRDSNPWLCNSVILKINQCCIFNLQTIQSLACNLLVFKAALVNTGCGYTAVFGWKGSAVCRSCKIKRRKIPHREETVQAGAAVAANSAED